MHPHSSILNQLPVEHQQFATKTLEKHGVEFILGVRVLGFDAASKMVAFFFFKDVAIIELHYDKLINNIRSL